MVKYVSSVEEFDAELKAAGSKLVVVDFTASWCGPCKSIAPVYEKFAEQYKDVVFLKVDVDEADDLCGKYGVSSMPTFQFFKNGESIDKFSGANKERLEEFLTKYK